MKPAEERLPDPEEVSEGDKLQVQYESSRSLNTICKTGKVIKVKCREDEEQISFIVISNGDDKDQRIKVSRITNDHVSARAYRADTETSKTTYLGELEEIEVKE